VTGLLVFSGGTRYDGVRGTDQQVADRLSELIDVLYVDPPESLLARARRTGPAQTALRLVRPGLWRLTPAAPPAAHRPGVHHLTDLLARRAVRRAARAVGRPVTAMVVTGTTDLYAAAPGARTLRYITDDLTAGAALVGMSAAALARTERRLARADEIAVVSPGLLERAEELGREATLVPNGCDSAIGAAVDAAPRPADLPPPPGGSTGWVGFVGHINGRIDIALLEAVAAAGHPLLLVGPRAPGYEPVRFPALVDRPNVHWVGPKPYTALPGYLAAVDVGLTPYADSAFNRASFPLKTLEYLAAGRGVVSTDLPATRWLTARDLIHVAAASDGPAGFAAAVTAALAVPRAPELVARRRSLAAAHDWTERVRLLAGLLHIETPTLKESR
jgi:teichuronic acid biosynthesis glycosyltransferase TuaH